VLLFRELFYKLKELLLLKSILLMLFKVIINRNDKFMKTRNVTNDLGIGMLVMILGTAMILLWIGIFKFTPSEAKSIQPLIENHPMMSWMYKILSVQGVSIAIGIVEIVTALVLIVGLFNSYILRLGGLLLILTFAVTLSFLITTPNVWNSVDGILTTDFFIIKDLVPFGLGIVLYGQK